jgi:hypothetical protein
MPLYINDKKVDIKALAEEHAKRNQLRPKYTLNRKRTDEDYENAKIIIGGEEKTISKSSSFLLDMITEENKE